MNTSKTIEEPFKYYAINLRKQLETNNIDLGELLKIEKQNGTTIEGYVLPQTEFGDPEILVLKLKNGYNIGIHQSEIKKIQKTGKKVKLEAFPTKKIKQKKGLPSVTLISTGGTIAARIDYMTGGVAMALTPSEILANIPELEELVNIKRIRSVFQIASEDVGPAQWISLAKAIYDEILKSDIDGIVITHGTDCMHYSSAAISFMVQDLPIPVVFTGAQRSGDRGSFDGALNLIHASIAAARSEIAETSIVMHETTSDETGIMIRGTRAKKMHTSRRDTFKSINDLPLARIHVDGRIDLINKKYKKRDREKTPKIFPEYENKVALVKAYPGADPEFLEWYIDKKYKGIIIEGTGLGHVPTSPPKGEERRSWIPQIKRAIEEGIFIGITSQSNHGRVHPHVYRNLRILNKTGATHLEDMIPEVALIKLGWVIGNHPSAGIKEIKELMLTPIAGEISSASRIKGFFDY